MTGMIAGTKYRGDFEDRIKNAIDEVKKAGNVDTVHRRASYHYRRWFGRGFGGCGEYPKAGAGRGDFQVIGATTIDEYRKHIEKDAALERRFQPVMVESLRRKRPWRS